jgi:hypothetical protein
MTPHTTKAWARIWATAACVLAAVSLLGGCSAPTTKFESKWKAASADYDRYELAHQQHEAREAQGVEEPRRALVIEGPWEGKWRSTKDSPSGALRCVLTRTGPDTYSADFHATYFWLFRFAYSMPLQVKRRDDTYNVVLFTGETDLGGGSGKFQYSGHASAEEFICTYRSSRDYGYFEMTRPGFGRGQVARAE